MIWREGKRELQQLGWWHYCYWIWWPASLYLPWILLALRVENIRNTSGINCCCREHREVKCSTTTTDTRETSKIFVSYWKTVLIFEKWMIFVIFMNMGGSSTNVCMRPHSMWTNCATAMRDAIWDARHPLQELLWMRRVRNLWLAAIERPQNPLNPLVNQDQWPWEWSQIQPCSWPPSMMIMDAECPKRVSDGLYLSWHSYIFNSKRLDIIFYSFPTENI